MCRRFWNECHALLPTQQYQLLRNSDKIRIFDGDLKKNKLGLTDEATSEIRDTATIYIHAASSINLHRPLPSIASSIVSPSLELADLALSSPHLTTFAYISTAYANAHLCHLHPSGTDTFVAEKVYSLRPCGVDSTLLEHADLCASGTSAEYAHHNFPFPYAYAKHLTERLLQARFSHLGRLSSLLIVRPSIIGPALREPFPCYEIRGSAPVTAFVAGLMTTLSLRMAFASGFSDPFNQSTIDEVPVDIVVNRIIMHISRTSSGCVHAVAGIRARRNFADLWQRAMSERRLPWKPRIAWRDVDWRETSLHPIPRTFVVTGTSFTFEDRKVDGLWEGLTEGERALFPLWLRYPSENVDLHLRRSGMMNVLEKWCRKQGISEGLVRFLVKRPIRDSV